MNQEEVNYLKYPGVYPDENQIIPYSPRGKFGFASPYEITTDKIIKLESMKNMSIDQIVELYRNGYNIEDSYIPKTLQQQQNSSYKFPYLGFGLVTLFLVL